MGTPSGWRFARVFVGAAMLLSFAGLRRRTTWRGDSSGELSAYGDRCRHNGAGRHAGDFECEVESKG
jgi:hypothetical protein